MLYSVVTSALALNVGSKTRGPTTRAPAASMEAVGAFETGPWKVYEHDPTSWTWSFGTGTTYAFPTASDGSAGGPVASYETGPWKVYEHDSTIGSSFGMNTVYASSAASAGGAEGGPVSPLEGPFVYGTRDSLSESIGVKTMYAAPAKETFERSVSPLEKKFVYSQSGNAAPLRSQFLTGTAQEHMVVDGAAGAPSAASAGSADGVPVSSFENGQWKVYDHDTTLGMTTVSSSAASAGGYEGGPVSSYENGQWKVYEHDATLGMTTVYTSAFGAAAGSIAGYEIDPSYRVYGSRATLSESIGVKTMYAAPAKETFERSVSPLEKTFVYSQSGNAAPLRSQFLTGTAQEHMVVDGAAGAPSAASAVPPPAETSVGMVTPTAGVTVEQEGETAEAEAATA